MGHNSLWAIFTFFPYTAHNLKAPPQKFSDFFAYIFSYFNESPPIISRSKFHGNFHGFRINDPINFLLNFFNKSSPFISGSIEYFRNIWDYKFFPIVNNIFFIPPRNMFPCWDFLFCPFPNIPRRIRGVWEIVLNIIY